MGMFAFLGLILATEFLPSECQRAGVVALTFEDGPSSYTATILDILKKNGVLASFHFSTAALNDPKSKEVIARAAKENHTVGLRTNPKRNYFEIDDQDVIDQDLEKQVTYIQDLIDDKVRFARSPLQDNMPDKYVYEFFTDNGIIMTQSAFSPYDISGVSPSEAIEDHFKTLMPAHESRIISLYGARLEEDNELQDIINEIKKAGFKFVTLDGCLPDFVAGESKLMFEKNSKESGT